MPRPPPHTSQHRLFPPYPLPYLPSSQSLCCCSCCCCYLLLLVSAGLHNEAVSFSHLCDGLPAAGRWALGSCLQANPEATQHFQHAVPQQHTTYSCLACCIPSTAISCYSGPSQHNTCITSPALRYLSYFAPCWPCSRLLSTRVSNTTSCT